MFCRLNVVDFFCILLGPRCKSVSCGLYKFCLHRLICQNVMSIPIAISPNENVTATNCQKVMIDADQATIVESPRPKPMSNSTAASQFSR